MLPQEVLAFDIDGVIVDYAGSFLAYVNEQLGTQRRYEECVYHNLADAFEVSHEQMQSLLMAYETPEVIANLPALEGALESLALLSTRYQIAIITSRKPIWEEVTKDWFDRHFPSAAIYYAMGRNNPFAGGVGRLHKPQVAEQIGALCLVEDNEHEFLHWDSPTVEPICFAQPWNNSVAVSHPHIPRLNWPGIIYHFLSR